MSFWNRIFGTRNKSPVPAPTGFIQYQNDEAGERMRWVPDQTANAIAARHNFAMIYGVNNMPPNFGMRPVIEVRDNAGAWVPVSGNTRGVPDLVTQEGYLKSWRETGIPGPQPINPDGTMATRDNPMPSGIIGPQGPDPRTAPGRAGVTGPMLSFGDSVPEGGVSPRAVLSFGPTIGSGGGAGGPGDAADQRSAGTLSFGPSIPAYDPRQLPTGNALTMPTMSDAAKQTQQSQAQQAQANPPKPASSRDAQSDQQRARSGGTAARNTRQLAAGRGGAQPLQPGQQMNLLLY